MQSAELQLWHTPSIWHGVFFWNRVMLIGEATERALLSAASVSCITLLSEITKITCFGPHVMAATLLPLPSMFTITPSSLMAFALER